MAPRRFRVQLVRCLNDTTSTWSMSTFRSWKTSGTNTTGHTMIGLTFSAHQFPQNPVEWLHEIDEAYRDARETLPFMPLVGVRPSESKLFHLAPRVAVKFRGYHCPALILPRRLRCRVMLHRRN